jgi:protein-tyrosine phosphatase
MVDLHTHILPGIDDGAASYDEALRLIDIEIDSGVDSVAVTPHFNPAEDEFEAFIENRGKALRGLENALSARNKRIRLVEGAEVLLSPELLKLPDLGCLCYSKTDYMLVELPMFTYSDWIERVLFELRLRGLTPVIAHVERYPYIQNKPKLLRDIVSAGNIAQLNAGRIETRDHKLQKFLFDLIRSNLVQIIASDAHSLILRPPRLKEAMNIIEKKLGQGAAGHFKKNAEAVVKNLKLDFNEPFELRKFT